MKKFRIISLALIALCVCLSAVSCDEAPSSTVPATSVETSGAAQTSTAPETSAVNTGNTTVSLNDADTLVNGEGAEFKDGTLSITKAGVYTVSGKLTNGQIYVNVEKPGEVELVLNGVDIKSSKTAAIYIACAGKIKINVANGTENKLSDATSYKFEEGTDEPNACIFSADDMTIKGSGTLIVTGNYKNGISSKNDIKIKEVNLTVNAYNTAIRGKDSVEIESGVIKIESGNDGIKSSNSTEIGRGYVLITGGDITIVAEDDGIQAETDVTVKGCTIKITANGKSVNSAGTVNVAEGCIK